MHEIEPKMKFTSIEWGMLTVAAGTLIIAIAGRFLPSPNAFSALLFDAATWALLIAFGISFLIRNNTKKDLLAAAIAFPIFVFTIFGVMLSDGITEISCKLFGTNKAEIIKILGLGISGIIAFYGFTILNRRAIAQDKANKLTEKGHVQDRFKAAVDHLSSEKSVSGRIASFYELSNLARDNKDTKDNYAQTVLDILCAHLRYVKNASLDQELTESQILIDMLFSQEENPFSSLYYDFRRAKLRYVDFQGIHKPKGKVSFGNADLRETCFDESDLTGFTFQQAILHDAGFRQTNLQEVDLRDADLHGADLSTAKNLQTAKLSRAKYGNDTNGKATKFPEGFKPEDYGMKLCSPVVMS